MVLVPCSIGDALDRMTILTIKKERISDPVKLEHVCRELEAIGKVAGGYCILRGIQDLYAMLKDVNGQLWDVEDSLRDMERRADFGESFVSLARSVYILNDKRAELKRLINEACGSELVEVKSYSSYQRNDSGA